MGKRRKPAAPSDGDKFVSAFEDRKGSKLKLSSWEDAMDSEDEFLANRDEILLDEGPDRKRLRKMREEEALLEASDEEILDIPDSEDESADDDDEEEAMAAVEEGEYNEYEEITGKKRTYEGEDELEGWGTSRKDLYGDDEMDTEADALAHEQEAKRIQQEHLKGMRDEDFGFGDDDWLHGVEPDAGDDDEKGIYIEKLPDITIAADATPEDQMEFLRRRYPEFETLRCEFLGLLSKYHDLSAADEKSANDAVSAIRRIKYQALSVYLGTLTMYFAVLTSTADEAGGALSMAPVELQNHEIMKGIVQARTSWQAASSIEEPNSSDASSSESEEEESDAPIPVPVQTKPKKRKADSQELKEAKRVARRAARLAAAEKEFANLVMPASETSSKKTKSKALRHTNGHAEDGNSDSDFGDETRLNERELAAKAAKKKSLRFFASQISAKASKRTVKGQEVGGDTDVPHREKWKERQARRQEEAERKMEKGRLNEVRPAPRQDAAGSDSDDYQQLVSRGAKVKAARKQAASDAYAAKEAAKIWGDEDMAEDGKRKISYQIEKNKGLAPHRKKDVRNPRVKKRKKFEEKKKKLSSIRAVYKGGPGKGGYQGEQTGIKTGLVKSIKLS